MTPGAFTFSVPNRVQWTRFGTQNRVGEWRAGGAVPSASVFELTGQ